MNKIRRHIAIVALIMLAACAVGATAYTGTEAGLTDWLGAFSGWAAAFAAPVQLVVLWYVIDWAVLDQFDTWEALSNDNRAVAHFVGALLIAFSICFAAVMGSYGQTRAPIDVHVDTAAQYVGVTERPPRSNEGPAVERFLAAVDLGPGYPYCAAAASAWAQWSGLPIPEAEDGTPIRTALATDFLHAKCVIDASDVLRGRKRPPPGSFVIWRKGNSKFGHAGVVTGDEMSPTSRTRWYGRCGRTIEANTTAPDGATQGTEAQRDGGGVWRRERCIRPHSYFRIVAFVPPTCRNAHG